MKRLAIAAAGLVLLMLLAACGGNGNATDSTAGQQTRTFESRQGFEVDVPPDWMIVPSTFSTDGALVSPDVFISPGRGLELAGSLQRGEIEWDEFVREASLLEDWAAITIISQDGPSGALDIAGELAGFQDDPEIRIVRHEEIVVDGNPALLVYYAGPVPQLTGMWDQAFVGFLAKRRVWAIGMTTASGRLADYQPVFETVYTSFSLR